MNTNTVHIGNVYHSVQRIDSTNNFLVRLLAVDKPREGFVIAAEEQLEGRGQYGRNWHASPGKNILCSTVLYPEFLAPSDQFSLNMVASNALRRVLSLYTSASVRVKWPNDVMVGERKIAGLLLQSSIHSDRLQYCIIGIGCNINENQFPDFRRPAVSLSMLEEKTYERSDIEGHLYGQLSEEYARLKQGEIESIQTEYNRYLWKRGQREWFETNVKGRFAAQLDRVLYHGDLVLEVNGKEECISSEKIRYVP